MSEAIDRDGVFSSVGHVCRVKTSVRRFGLESEMQAKPAFARSTHERRPMIKHLPRFVCAAVCLSASTVAATAQSTPAVTKAAQDPKVQAMDNQLAQSVVDAVNAHDPIDRTRWAASRHSTKEGAYSVDSLTKMLTDIRNVSKSVVLLGVERRGNWVNIELRAPNNRIGKLQLRTDTDDGNKVLGFNAFARPSVYAKPLVDKPVSRAALRDAIDQRLRFSAEKDEFSGAILVMKGDEVVYQSAFGHADKDFGVPNTLDTRFHTGSMDKMFTATLIGQLIEEGKLSLDTPVIKILPDYPDAEAAAKITVRHLLSHQSGVAYSFGGPESDRLKPYDMVTELLPRFAAKPMLFEPGSKASYSNEGFLVLGAIVERLTGKSYYEVVQEKVFVPAGMKNTVYYRIDEIAPLRAVGYRFPEADFLGFGDRVNNWTFMGLGHRGASAGGSYSTVGDMTLFLKALRGGRILSPAMAEQMTSLQGGLRDYGYGFLHRKVGDKSVRGHTGGGAFSGINGISRIVWENNYSIVVMGNYDAPLIEWVGDDIVKMVAAQL